MPQTDILVIGAGPSGLFVASELARHGIEVRLVEKDVQRHRQARATAIQPGTLEILDSVDLLSPFLEAAEAIAALDRHLASYLIPDPSIGPV
ncbi:MAG: FAD-dependent oxidoreductase [Chthoniobacterales bacterium]